MDAWNPTPLAPSSLSFPIQHLAALSAHAEAIRAKVRGVGKSVRGLEGRKAQRGEMEGGDERGENKEERSGEDGGKQDQGKKEKEEEGGKGEKEGGEKEGGMRDEVKEKTIDLVDETTEEGDEEILNTNSAGEAREEMTLGLQHKQGEAPVEAAGEGLGREGREGRAAERPGEAGRCEGDDDTEECERDEEAEEAEEDVMEEGVGENCHSDEIPFPHPCALPLPLVPLPFLFFRVPFLLPDIYKAFPLLTLFVAPLDSNSRFSITPHRPSASPALLSQPLGTAAGRSFLHSKGEGQEKGAEETGARENMQGSMIAGRRRRVSMVGSEEWEYGDWEGAEEPLANELLVSVERWARDAGLCGAAAVAEAAADGQGSASEGGGSRVEVQSALGGNPSESEIKARVWGEIDTLLWLSRREFSSDRERLVEKCALAAAVHFLTSLPLTEQQINPPAAAAHPTTLPARQNPAAERPNHLPASQEIAPATQQLNPPSQHIALSGCHLNHFLALAPTFRPTLLPSLASLTTYRTSVSPRDMLFLLRLPALTSLSFHQTRVVPEALLLLQSFTRLHRLILDCPGPSTLSFKPSKGTLPLRGLRELHVSRVTDSVLQQVGMLTSLEVFSCTCSEGVSFRGWMSLQWLQQLRLLRVGPAHLDRHALRIDYPNGRLPTVSRVFERLVKTQEDAAARKKSVQEVTHLKRLTRQEDDGNDDDGGVWTVVSLLQRLQCLELHGIPHSIYACVSLVELSLLTSLHITGTCLGNDAFTRLTSLTWLTHLSLAGCTFTTDGLVMKIAHCLPSLVFLDLSGTAVTQGDTVNMQSLKCLKHLKLQQCCNIGGPFVRYLCLVPRLRVLDLGFNHMPAVWLTHIVEGKRVRRLSVRGCGYMGKTVCGLERPWIVIES
ncbi:unnamed protein product [Closterium sp. Yama58-4]|nr:unnamed protein product [Closterium sp. Yama58-4]